jgi:phosphate transport system permease protein
MGETAPLIMTAGISNLWYKGAFEPVASLTYFVYTYATSPFSNWITLAWGAAFILIIMIMAINISVRVVTRGGRVHT